MNAPSPSTTPARVSTVSRAFAYTTPDPTRIRNDSQHLLATDNYILGCNEDALPTRFRSRAVRGGLHPGCDPVPGDGSDSHVPELALTVLTKRKRRSRGTEALSLATGSTADRLSATHGSSIQRRTGKTRPRTRSTSAMGGGAHDHDQGPSLSNLPASPTRPRSRCMVLDAVEIVSKKSQGHMTNLRAVCDGCPTESVRRLGSSHYPSPPVSRAPKDDVVHDSSSRPITEPEERVSPDPVLPLKTSKYFARVSTPPMRSIPECIADLTPPSSPILTIPVYIESSDFEYPPLDASLDEPAEDTVDEPACISSWHNNPGLFDDLMIMLRRLKPILVQESVRDDPWKVLIAVRLLNVTTGKAAIPVFCKIISRWPTPQDLVHAPQDELVELLRPLGLYNKRASWLKDISGYFLGDREGPSCSETSLASLLSEERTVPPAPHLHYLGVGPYALDSLRIFCVGDKDAWKWVMPRDKELVRYLHWRWAIEEGKVWYPGGMGVIGDVDVPYLITLVDELATHYDGAIGGEGTKYTVALNYSKPR